MKPKPPKQLDAVADIVLAYRPTAKSKPAVQRKRRATILKNATPKDEGGVQSGAGVNELVTSACAPDEDDTMPSERWRERDRRRW